MVEDLRQDKSISIYPIRILRVECHEFVEEDVSDRCHTHGRTRVAGVGCEGGIDLEKSSVKAHQEAVLSALLW